MQSTRTILVALVVVLLATPVAAHVPGFPADNTTPDRAVEVPDAVKSWSFYDRLDRGSVGYYRFSLGAGERLRVSAFTPVGDAFTPSLVVMSPSLNGSSDVPAGVTVPEGMGAVVVEGERPERAGYEPFAPSASYETASVERPVEAETTYLVAVYEPANRSGPAGVAIGSAEAFSPTEYLLVPFDLVRTHLWAGQHPFVAVGPFLLTILAGLGLVRRRRDGDWSGSPRRVVIGVAGLAILGSGVNTLVQMGLALAQSGPTPAALVTAVFVAVPAVCGGWVLQTTLREEVTLSGRTRAGLVIAGGLSLLTWAGFVVFPALLVVAAAIPGQLLNR